MRLRTVTVALVLALAVAMVGYVNAQFNVVQPAGGSLGVTGGVTSVQGSVSIQNTVQVVLPTPLAIATPTYNVAVQAIPTHGVVSFPGATVPVTIPTGNPCMNVGVAPVCLPLAIPSATTVVLVGSSGSQQIFGCSYSYSVASGGSFQFLQASATASAICPTPTVALTGTQAGGQAFGQFGTVSAGNKLCGVAAGAVVNAQGVFCYVQQ